MIVPAFVRRVPVPKNIHSYKKPILTVTRGGWNGLAQCFYDVGTLIIEFMPSGEIVAAYQREMQ